MPLLKSEITDIDQATPERALFFDVAHRLETYGHVTDGQLEMLYGLAHYISAKVVDYNPPKHID